MTRGTWRSGTAASAAEVLAVGTLPAAASRSRRVVAGDPATLIKVVLDGPAQVLPADRPKYQVVMPPFAAAFSDADIAETLTFVRRAFGNGAAAITTAQVKSQR
jgi:hypothetical protein